MSWCKKGSMYGMLLSATVIFSAASGVHAQDVTARNEAAALRREMNQAARNYEHMLRRMAATRPSPGTGSCDEQVGRFCVTYDRGRPPALPPEAPEITRARNRVIAAYRQGLERFAADTAVVAPLVRYLVEADSIDAAVAVAARASGVWRNLLLGFAHFAGKRMADAERAYDQAIGALEEKERLRAVDPQKLFAERERSHFKALPPDVRNAYERNLWIVADPLYLTAGNDARVEHITRYVWSRILERAPLVTGATSWGWDSEELTRRFGVPFGRTKDFGGYNREPNITEHFHPEQLTYVPPELSRAGITTHEPGAGWPFDTVRSRSGFAPTTVRAMRVLEHAASRFPERDSALLRVDAQLPLDSLVKRPARIEFGLFILDTALNIVAETRDTVSATDSLVKAMLELRFGASAYAYSLEARELETLQAARARAVLHPLPARVSDPVLLPASGDLPASRGDERFRPMTSLVIPRDSAFTVYLEVGGLAPNADDQVRYRVTLNVDQRDRPGLLSRAVTGVGNAIGIRPAVRPQVTWAEQKPAAEMVPIVFRIADLKLRPGRHLLRFQIIDEVRASVQQVERLIVVK